MAFKWTDETADTILRQIEWSASRTGLINPVAIFDPVELEGTKVSRASVHNISIMEGLKLGIGDVIRVFKANMIIPQIAKNLTESGNVRVPEVCPVCGQPTRICSINDVKTLYCDNAECQAKHVKSFSLLVSRDALNIDGLSEATLEKFIQKGFIKDKTDIFHLDRYKDEIVAMEGFGEKSYANLLEAVERARDTDMVRLIYGLGIDNVGLSTAKLIVKYLDSKPQAVLSVDAVKLTAIDGIGEVIAASFVKYFKDEARQQEYLGLLKELRLKQPEVKETEELSGKTFVITGAVTHFANRKELKELIENMGGKVTGSVTGNTSYLINNDSMSQSAKNKTAAKLGVPVITEEEFIRLAGLEDML